MIRNGIDLVLRVRPLTNMVGDGFQVWVAGVWWDGTYMYEVSPDKPTAIRKLENALKERASSRSH